MGFGGHSCGSQFRPCDPLFFLNLDPMLVLKVPMLRDLNVMHVRGVNGTCSDCAQNDASFKWVDLSLERASCLPGAIHGRLTPYVDPLEGDGFPMQGMPGPRNLL